jgi:SulP family sulfate permease
MYRVTRPPLRVDHDGAAVVVRFDGPLFYGNVERFEQQLKALLDQSPPPRAVVLDATGVDDIDATADHALRKIATRYRDHQVRLLFAGVKEEVRAVIDASGLTALVGADAYFETDAEAVRSVR